MEFGDADGRTGMASGVSEHLDHEIGKPIEHIGRLVEPWSTVDESEDAHDTPTTALSPWFGLARIVHRCPFHDSINVCVTPCEFWYSPTATHHDLDAQEIPHRPLPSGCFVSTLVHPCPSHDSMNQPMP